MASGVILLKDLPAEKSTTSFGGLRISNKPVNALRGELLIAIPIDQLVARKGGGKPHNYRLARDTTVSLRAELDDVAPLSVRTLALLEAVTSCHARYSIFLSTTKLDWGLSLQVGSEVYVVVNPEAPQPAWVHSKAVVRWFGDMRDQQGTFFGVEITEEAFCGQGETDGTFQGKRYFTCEDNCGFLVALDKLSPEREESLKTEDKALEEDLEEGLFDNLKHDLEQIEEKIKLRHKAQKLQLQQQLVRSQHKEQDLRMQLAQSQRAEENLKSQLAQATQAMQDLRERLAQTERRLRESVQTEHDLRRQVTQLSEQQQMEKQKSSRELEFWNVPRTDIQIVSEIGRGGWGTVFKGTFQGRAVAVKQLHPDILSKDHILRLRREVRMMAQVRHPNLLLFIAAVFDGEVERLRSPPLIVMELLDTDLRKAYERGLVDAQSKLSIFQDVAFALNYLHNCREPIIHRDLSAPNVLLEALANNRWKAKVSDFGSANLVKFAKTAAEGAVIYSAPETFPIEIRGPDAPNVPQTPKIDVYSYGVLLCEVITCKQPDQLSQLKAEVQQSWPFMHSLITSCTKYHPNDRPTMDHILNDLQKASISRGNDRPNHGKHISIQSRPIQRNVSQQGNFQRSSSSPLQPPELAQHDHGRQSHQQLQPSQPHLGNHQPLYNPLVIAPSPAGESDPALSLGIGSMVQVSDPPRYGVLRWLGSLAEVPGTIAGVEMEEAMNGCSDGSRNGVQYFSCKPGRGLFCPLSSLRPDERFTIPGETPVAAAVRNPLWKWPLDENFDQQSEDIDVEKYIGEERGIQGHQNSCYLDATVFGLFAVSDVFDSMFLKAPPDQDISEILWKRIVNPLRKHGVVRFESVMALRNKLEEIGKMKGVNQDEKDPEEFLNMLFKHVLHVEPYITIKRPFGVEQEYFVQLFLEFDETVKIPSVGFLLRKMFREQSISFTEAPAQLLIQIPRFGKTYEKIVPDMNLDVGGLLPSPYKCFICEESAWKKCISCGSEYDSADGVYFCDTCCDRTHSRESRHNHQVEIATATKSYLQLLSVICIETSHYVCFAHTEGRWIFMDSMAKRVYDTYNIPKGVDCTRDLSEWVYTQDRSRLLSTPPRELPEYVRRFTQDIYMCVYINPYVGMYM